MILTTLKSLAAILLLTASTLSMAAPQVGEPAPAFSLQASDGKTYTLSEIIGEGGVVIAFFPKAFTGG